MLRVKNAFPAALSRAVAGIRVHPRREPSMPRIISIATLLLGLALGASVTSAQDETMPEGAPAPVPEAAPAAAAPVVLQENVPTRYTVVRGDTLWGISSRFLKNPWKWPDLWGINKDEIRNPHRIYPGDVVILDLSGNTPRLRLEGAADGGASRWYGYELQTSRLSPQMRGSALDALQIPTIPARAIEPFLVRPLIVDNEQVARAPVIVANTDKRVVVSAGDTAYVTGLDPQKGPRWQVFRKGRAFQDPDTKELLGFEAVYLGDADVTGTGEVSTVQIARAIQEIATGDRLAVMRADPISSYIPRAPAKTIRGRIIAGGDNAVVEMGTYSVIIINRGARDGMEVGHVLGLYRSEGTVEVDARAVKLPEQRYGVALVFRVFDKISYALIMASRRQANVLDTVGNP